MEKITLNTLVKNGQQVRFFAALPVGHIHVISQNLTACLGYKHLLIKTRFGFF